MKRKLRLQAVLIALIIALPLAFAACRSKKTDTTVVPPPDEQPAKEIVVSFDLGYAGAQTFNDIDVVAGDPYGTLPNVPNRSGYVFAGWFTDAGDLVTAETVVTITVDHKLTARWNQALAVTFDKSHSDLNSERPWTNVSPSSVSAVNGAALPAITPPTRTGYAFEGFFDGDGKQYYTAAGAGATTWDKTAGAVLYAHWAALTLTIVYDAASYAGTGFTPPAPYTVTFDGAVASGLAEFGERFPNSLTPKSKHGFMGWYSKDGSVSGNWGYKLANAATVLAHKDASGSTATVFARFGRTVYDFTDPADADKFEMEALDGVHGGATVNSAVEKTYDPAKPALKIAIKATTVKTLTIDLNVPLNPGDVAVFTVSATLPSAAARGIALKTTSVTNNWDTETNATLGAAGQTTMPAVQVIAKAATAGDLYATRGVRLHVCLWGTTAVPNSVAAQNGMIIYIESVTILLAKDAWNFTDPTDVMCFDTENRKNGGETAPYIDAAKNDLGKKWLALPAGGWGNIMLMPPTLGIGDSITFIVDYNGSKPGSQISFAHATSEWTMVTTTMTTESLGGTIYKLTMTRPANSRNTISLGTGLSGRTVYITDVEITKA